MGSRVERPHGAVPGPHPVGSRLAGLAAVTSLLVSGCATTTAASGGRGDGATATGLRIELGSSFVDGHFSASSTCDEPGHDYSAQLAFHQTSPAGSLALTMVDLDNAKVHWIQTGIPGDAAGIEEHTIVPGAREWNNDLGEATYDGPCPPPGETHRYRLTLYALEAPVDLTTARTPTDAVRELERQAGARSSVEASYTRAA